MAWSKAARLASALSRKRRAAMKRRGVFGMDVGVGKVYKAPKLSTVKAVGTGKVHKAATARQTPRAGTFDEQDVVNRSSVWKALTAAQKKTAKVSMYVNSAGGPKKVTKSYASYQKYAKALAAKNKRAAVKARKVRAAAKVQRVATAWGQRRSVGTGKIHKVATARQTKGR